MTLLKNKSSFFNSRFNNLTFWLAIVFSFINILLIVTSSSELISLNNQENYARWIFYYHVPIAWNAGISFLLGGCYSLLYIRTKNTPFVG